MVASFADAYTSVSVLADFARRHHGSRGSRLLCTKLLLCGVPSFCDSMVHHLSGVFPSENTEILIL